jgi:drug/metabolite transporter (DMT)-like permease
MNGWLRGTTATVVVGASFPVSAALVAYPYATGQMIRYAAGALILTALLKGRVGKPTASELVRLALVAAVGLAGFNLALLGAVERIGATNTGVIVGATPILLALGTRSRDPRTVGCAIVVVAGAIVVNGTDGAITVAGGALALAALLAEVGFTLLAAPLLPRLGPTRVAAWAAYLATAELALLAGAHVPAPTTQELAAIGYLAVMTTAVAFVLWFGAVQRLGAGRAGLLVGLMPVAAVAADALLNGTAPSPADIAGTALVAAGVAFGAAPARAARARRRVALA